MTGESHGRSGRAPSGPRRADRPSVARLRARAAGTAPVPPAPVAEAGGALGYGVRLRTHAAYDHPVGTLLTP